jgi:peptidoglycan/LPS O-acetylase OafA/YrhL
MKKFASYKIILAFVAVVVAALWVTATITKTMEWFTFGVACAILSGAAAVTFFFRAFIGENVVIKKSLLLVSGAFAVICTITIINEFAFNKNYIIPIIALIGALCLFFGYVLTGGRRWDTGENQKVGYKTYRERKAEEEKAKAETKTKVKEENN